MKFIYILTTAFLLIQAKGAFAGLIYSEDFEDNDAADTFGTSNAGY